MDIEAVSKKIQKQLNIPRITVYSLDKTPDKPNTPCCIQLLGQSNYNQTFSGVENVIIRLLFLIDKRDRPSAFSKILPLVQDSDSQQSVYYWLVTKLEADSNQTLDDTCSFIELKTNSGAGVTNWSGVDYLSTEFELEVFE